MLLLASFVTFGQEIEVGVIKNRQSNEKINVRCADNTCVEFNYYFTRMNNAEEVLLNQEPVSLEKLESLGKDDSKLWNDYFATGEVFYASGVSAEFLVEVASNGFFFSVLAIPIVTPAVAVAGVATAVAETAYSIVMLPIRLVKNHSYKNTIKKLNKQDTDIKIGKAKFKDLIETLKKL